MNEVERIYAALQKEQAELASAALRSPSSRDLFEYGRVTGMYAGLERAIEVVKSINREEDDDI
jgi:hypothetical protein